MKKIRRENEEYIDTYIYIYIYQGGNGEESVLEEKKLKRLPMVVLCFLFCVCCFLVRICICMQISPTLRVLHHDDSIYCNA